MIGHRRISRGAFGVFLAGLMIMVAPGRGRAEEPRVVELRFMGPGGPIAGAFDDVVRAFERRSVEENRKDPNRPIYRIISGQDAAYDVTGDPTRFLISIAGGIPPDVVKFDRFAITEWAARNAFLPLDEFLARDLAEGHPGAIHKEEFYENVWEEAVYQGKTYAVPSDVDDRALVYNKDLLKRAGLVDPATGEAKPPRTWEELREYARKLTRYDDFGRLHTVGFAPNYGNSWLYMFGWLAGGEFMSADGRRVTLNAPPIIEALGFMHDVYSDSGGYANVMAFQLGFQGGFLDPFIQGKVAMKIEGSWYMPMLSQFGHDVDFGVVAAPMPAARLAAGAKPVSWSGGFAFAIPSNAHHKEAAWEFIRFAASDEGFRLFIEGERQVAEALGYPYVVAFVPKVKLNAELVRKNVLDNPRMSDRVKEGMKVFMTLLPRARFRPVTPVAQLMWSQQVSAMEEALYERKTPKDALDYATGVVQRDLDAILKPKTGAPIDIRIFLAAYGLLLIGTAVCIYLWDTNVAFRRKVARKLGYRGEVSIGDVIEGSRGGYFRSQWRAGLLCSSPWIIGFVVFGGGPLLFSMLMSFCDYDVLSPPRFIGLQNYRVMFAGDELAPKAFLNTVFVMLRIPVSMSLGLGVALLLHQRLRGMTLFRAIFYLPAILPAVAGFMLWLWVFNPAGGPINTFLATLGVHGPGWLLDARWSKPSIMIMSLWGVGGGMILWLAGLGSIDRQLYEAAQIDGASEWRQFLHITLPQLSPYIFFVAIMSLIDGFKIFDEAFIMTHGGPVNSTLFYVYHLFNNAFRYGHMGYACALAWVLFLIIIAFTLFQMKMAKKWVHYEGD